MIVSNKIIHLVINNLNFDYYVFNTFLFWAYLFKSEEEKKNDTHFND